MNMQMKASDEVRRLAFFGALACLALVAPAESDTTEKPLARFGLLADVHIDQRHFGEPIESRPDVYWPKGPLYPF